MRARSTAAGLRFHQQVVVAAGIAGGLAVPACAPSNCRARSPAARRPAPARGHASPRLRYRTGCCPVPWECAGARAARRRTGNTCWPAAPSRNELLRYWLLPRTAPRKCPMRPRATSGANSTRARCVVSLRAPQPRHGALARLAPDGLRGFQVARIARRAVPVVALHVVAGLRQQHAAHAVAGGRVTGEEAVRVAVHAHAPVAADSRAFGIGDARVHVAARGFAGARAFDRLFRRHVPGMVEVEIRNVAAPARRDPPARSNRPPRCSARCRRPSRPSPPPRAPTGRRCWPSPCACRSTP